MKHFIIVGSLLWLMFGAMDARSQTSVNGVVVYDRFDDIQPLLQQNNDTLYVINFWATWCKPCIAELPYFEALNAGYSHTNVRVILVSLDFKKHLEKRVIPFIEKREIQSDVVLLDDPKSTYWIDRVDTEWSGAIPATLFYRGSERLFMEHEFESYDELHSIVQQFIKT